MHKLITSHGVVLASATNFKRPPSTETWDERGWAGGRGCFGDIWGTDLAFRPPLVDSTTYPQPRLPSPPTGAFCPTLSLIPADARSTFVVWSPHLILSSFAFPQSGRVNTLLLFSPLSHFLLKSVLCISTLHQRVS